MGFEASVAGDGGDEAELAESFTVYRKPLFAHVAVAVQSCSTNSIAAPLSGTRNPIPSIWRPAVEHPLDAHGHLLGRPGWLPRHFGQDRVRAPRRGSSPAR